MHARAAQIEIVRRIARVEHDIAARSGDHILDDGTVARLGNDRWFVTTTTSGIGQMESWLRWWTEGTGWCAHVVNVTSTYGAVNLAGPRSREVLARLTALDLTEPMLQAAREGCNAELAQVVRSNDLTLANSLKDPGWMFGTWCHRRWLNCATPCPC
jgi:glycine cleavage system aminomethyltransferase T